MCRFACVASVVLVAAGGLAMLTGMGKGVDTSTAVATAQAEGFKIDPVHSMILFRIQHNGVAYSGGRFNEFSGTFNLDAAKPEASSVDLTIKIESVDTAAGKRDQHLKSNDFFAAKEFPEATFKSTGVKAGSEPGTFEVSGDLTIRGTKKPVTIKVKETGRGQGQRGGELAGMWAETTIKRSDFGVNFMVGKMLSDEVLLTFSFEGGK